MPKFTKCWYNDCDSDNRENPKLLFYKFPKDSERSEQWVNSCANAELTNIWKNNPEKVTTFRVCQKHFLKEFLGTSRRLIGHAVPAPYGVSLDRINAEKFMVDCASLKSTSNLNRQQRFQPQLQSQEPMPESVYCTMGNPIMMSTDQNDTYNQPLIMKSRSSVNIESPPSGLLMTVDQSNYHHHHHQVIQNPLINDNNSSYYTSPSDIQFITPYVSNQEQLQLDGNNMSCITETINIQPSQYQHSSTTVMTDSSPGTSKVNRNANPKINYDREGKVVSIQYPTETLSMMKTDDKEQHHAHILALKHKVRHYQRRLAVINHRYQKLRGQMKGRSNKMRLLESLKICKNDFDPCIFEIFKRQIKGPTSKHGNRWSNDVKSFSSAIYMRSRSAYKYIRKTIDLPSESIVKRYIGEKRLSKLSNTGEDDEEEEFNIVEEVEGPKSVNEDPQKSQYID